MRKKYKTTSANKRPSECCVRCNRMGYAAIPLYLRLDEFASVTVCFKTYCTLCGHIPLYRIRTKSGQEKTVPAVYAQDYFGFVRTEPRGFYLPAHLYQTPNGKLDVAQKTELCRAFLRLVLAHPDRHEFTVDEMEAEWRRG